MSLIFLMGLSLSGCVHFKLTKRSVFFVDAIKQTCREYMIIDDRPKTKFEYVIEHPISYCNGFIAVMPLDFKEGQGVWESQFKQKDGN